MELLVVIAIIALLIGILVPTVAAVRRAAKTTASNVVIQTLGNGLEWAKNETGAYTPSGSDYAPNIPRTDQDKVTVMNPYTGTGGNKIEITGAGLLVWGLVGADLLGAPSFRTFRSASEFWSADTDSAPKDSATDPTQSGAYAMKADGTPIQRRAGGYVELSKVKMTPRSKDAGHENQFVVEAEAANAEIYRDYPMFLDAFGYPVLYWRADAAGKAWVDKNVGLNGGTLCPFGTYHWIDNAALLVNTGAPNRPANINDALGIDQSKSLRLADGWGDHKLHWASGGGAYSQYPTKDGVEPPVDTFQSYIMNASVKATRAPHCPDTYLLVSPGADGIYGTSDDVTNFSGGK